MPSSGCRNEMALVTVEGSQSDSPLSGGSSDNSATTNGGESAEKAEEPPEEDDKDDTVRTSRSLSDCYFPSNRTALVLPLNNELQRPASRRVSASGPSDIQHHLQSMFYHLRPEETLKMAVKLESAHPGRTRYLVVVSRLAPARDNNDQGGEESCLLGIDCNEITTVGLVLRVLADTAITLDGDGGFSVSSCGKQHIFKPVSVQAMWSALQTLHKVSSKARENNYFLGGLTHEWATYYEQRVDSERSCLNEWHAMDNLESKRPPSPNSLRSKPCERAETETVIRSALKEIMMSVDLDEVTCKYIRGRLEEMLDMDLGEFKHFIDQEMLTILGQMDSATEVFEHVYLGSEWNASNLEELQKNGVGHILNITREIDNFFPGTFNYLNVRVYDDEKTDLLRHWDNTFRYINRARQDGSKVLVHCKMGVSRSASVVIAYAMKAYNWNLPQAIEFVKQKRSCIKPNTAFMSQLETYQGILDAVKNKERLLRSKSETNLKSPGPVLKIEDTVDAILNESTQSSQLTTSSFLTVDWTTGRDLATTGRPKSWSPDNTTDLFTSPLTAPTSLSMEHLLSDEQPVKEDAEKFEDFEEVSQEETVEIDNKVCFCELKENCGVETRNYNLSVRLPCSNGQTYSVSQNKVMFLPTCTGPDCMSSVKLIVNELESQSGVSVSRPTSQVPDLTGLVLNLTSQFEGSKEVSAIEQEELSSSALTKQPPPLLQAKLLKKETWDPAEHKNPLTEMAPPPSSNPQPIPAPNSKPKPDDPFSAQLDRVFDREEKRQQRLSSSLPIEATNQCLLSQEKSAIPVSTEQLLRECPSRQSSWSSYDSAVILRESPSRQSSWGSADTRCTYGTLPSRNSSWGSYDIRRGSKLSEDFPEQHFSYDRESIPFYPGTVKRTKQKIESESSIKRVCSEAPDPITETSTATIKLLKSGQPIVPVSKPSSCHVPKEQPKQNSSPKGRSPGQLVKSKEDVGKKSPLVDKTNSAGNKTTNPPGVVKNLKKEFEAKSVVLRNAKSLSVSSSEPTKEKELPKSEPTSPTAEDLSVKLLVDKFEVNNKGWTSFCRSISTSPPNRLISSEGGCPKRRSSPASLCPQPPVPQRKSSFEATAAGKNNVIVTNCIIQGRGGNLKPPPPQPTVLSIAKCKKQQGKTHPLNRLAPAFTKARHNNPVFNTM
ncbi:protein phosphatase Slingshot isoform X2 [Neocloeon triangulifer]|uniref:protein phosphatase Slingshot isoform X2 n=1 Tax=Neocloeon triangulifer TaxID=2078957 RepID=UPI00286ED407|nr:protein phosphatase Slingshot isoform X2 [Neocloeon triangulifer]